MIEEEEKAEEARLDEILFLWNNFIAKFIQLRTCWEKILNFIAENNIVTLQNAPVELQRFLAKFRNQKFTVLLPRIVTYFKSQGGLEEMKIKVKKKKLDSKKKD